jgi:hypothetical protein
MLYGETPLAFGKEEKAKVFGRGGLRLSFQQAPGQSTTFDPTNFQEIEFMPEYMLVLSKYNGVKFYITAAGWVGEKITPTDVEPAAQTTWGWGVGPGLEFADGSWVDGRCGQSDRVGANPAFPLPPALRPSHGLQCRSMGEINIPKTGGVGGIVFDITASLFGDSPTLTPGVFVSTTVSNVTFTYGVRADVAPLIEKWKSGGKTPPPDRPSAIGGGNTDLRFGPIQRFTR